jgi:hypothetical protein
MRNLLPSRSAVLLMFLATVVSAQEPDVVERTLYLSEHPGEAADRVYVAGRIATVLRFESLVDPERTRMLGWEGWFEPLLVGGKKVVLEPLRDIEPGDRFMLLVTLRDGAEIPFIVTSRQQPLDGRREADQQVNVFRNADSPHAAQTSLYETLKRARALQEKVDHYEQEDSVDRALAAVLAKDATRQTSFRERKKYVLQEGGVEFVVRLFSGKGKAAVVFKITNREDSSWKMKMARLYTATGWKERPFALRTDREEIIPGTTGYVAVVADKSAFDGARGAEQLLLEIYRDDGYRQLLVLLDPILTHE